MRKVLHGTSSFDVFVASMEKRNLPCIQELSAPVEAIARAFGKMGLVPARFRLHAETLGIICARWHELALSADVDTALRSAGELTALALRADTTVRTARSQLVGADSVAHTEALRCAGSEFFHRHGGSATDVWAADVVSKLAAYSLAHDASTEGRVSALVYRAALAALTVLTVTPAQFARAVEDAIPAQLEWMWTLAPLNNDSLFEDKKTAIVPLSRVRPGRKPLVLVRPHNDR